jgi:hypothetical protein
MPLDFFVACTGAIMTDLYTTTNLICRPRADNHGIYYYEKWFDVEMDLSDDVNIWQDSPKLPDERCIKAGAIVTYKYIGNYNGRGRPMNPKIIQARHEFKNWNQLVDHMNKGHSPKRNTSNSKYLSFPNLEKQI